VSVDGRVQSSPEAMPKNSPERVLARFAAVSSNHTRANLFPSCPAMDTLLKPGATEAPDAEENTPKMRSPPKDCPAVIDASVALIFLIPRALVEPDEIAPPVVARLRKPLLPLSTTSITSEPVAMLVEELVFRPIAADPDKEIPAFVEPMVSARALSMTSLFFMVFIVIVFICLLYYQVILRENIRGYMAAEVPSSKHLLIQRQLF